MVRFGDVEVDVPGRELLRGGVTVHLEPQAFDLLVALLEHRDRVLSKNELLDGVWGHRFVSEANLTTRIKEIRRAVGDDGVQQHTIKNVRGRGYRFVAKMHDLATTTARRDALIGRQGDITSLLETMTRSSVVTLTGTGGVGKSALARVVAECAAQSYAHGTRVVELSTLDDGEHVLAAVAHALDIVLDGERTERAIRSIAELDVLLLLDNCEHVSDEVGSLLNRVFAVGGAGVRVLATSRVRLGLSVEQVVTVHPLNAEEALELFTVRALAVRSSLDVDEVGRDRVATLLAGLDQLPLTIEMAAARLGSMTFDELERAIVQSMPMPVTHRSPVHRHRSLTSLVAWSAELLDESLRRTFTEFSVFAGFVSATDATAVVGAGRPEAMFDLAALAERSLLVADVGAAVTRYRMLATVRSVATNWLNESDADDVRRRHAQYFAEAVRVIDLQIRTIDEDKGRQRLESIVAEVRAAHGWARQHDPVLAAAMSGDLHLAAYSTFWNEPVEWTRSLLAGRADANDDAFAGAYLMLAGANANRGHVAESRAAVTALTMAADKRVRATALEILADVAIYDGHLLEVAAITHELGRLGEELDDPHARAIAAVDAALAYAFDDDAVSALNVLSALDVTSLSPSDRAWVVYARGEALSAASHSDATAAYGEAIEIAQAIGNPFVTSVARVSLAAEQARAGDVWDALDTYAQCLHDSARHGNFVHAVTILRGLPDVLVAVGDDHVATVLASATSGDDVRPSYGIETTRLSTLVAGIEQRTVASDFAAWMGEGRLLDLPQAVQVAAASVDRHIDRHVDRLGG